VSAINWLASNGRASKIRVANMSLGGPSSVAVCNAVYWAIRAGITFVVAAGWKLLAAAAAAWQLCRRQLMLVCRCMSAGCYLCGGSRCDSATGVRSS
jgi:hypothetical protein